MRIDRGTILWLGFWTAVPFICLLSLPIALLRAVVFVGVNVLHDIDYLATTYESTKQRVQHIRETQA